MWGGQRESHCELGAEDRRASRLSAARGGRITGKRRNLVYGARAIGSGSNIECARCMWLKMIQQTAEKVSVSLSANHAIACALPNGAMDCREVRGHCSRASLVLEVTCELERARIRLNAYSLPVEQTGVGETNRNIICGSTTERRLVRERSHTVGIQAARIISSAQWLVTSCEQRVVRHRCG
jgi:hypothetical protein